MKMLAIALLLAAPREETVSAWERAVELTESRILRELSSKAGFLATDFLPRVDRESVSRALEAGEVFTTAPGRVEIPGGMVHHWLGAVLVPGADVEDLVRWLQEYDEHDERFDDVEDSRLLSREDRFEIFLVASPKEDRDRSLRDGASSPPIGATGPDAIRASAERRVSRRSRTPGPATKRRNRREAIEGFSGVSTPTGGSSRSPEVWWSNASR
jgi:hypothetical protein